MKFAYCLSQSKFFWGAAISQGSNSFLRGPSLLLRGPSLLLRGPSLVCWGPSLLLRGPSTFEQGMGPALYKKRLKS